MKIKRSVLTMLLALVLMLPLLPVEVSANSPAPAPEFTFFVSDVPEGTVYVDLLIYLPKTDPHYQELVSGNLPEGFPEDAQIIGFCEGDFRSYTFHYRGARSDIRVDEYDSVRFFADGSIIYSEESTAYEHREDIEARGDIRLAMLDAQGNILKVSKPQSIKPSGLFSYSLNSFQYDAARDELIVESHSNSLGVVAFAFVSLAGLVLTCFVEWEVALHFDGIKAYSRLVVWTNLVSQLLMRAAQVLFLWAVGAAGIGIHYYLLVFILELLVYPCEFLFYRWKMRNISRKRCLLYTVTANTASLILGLILLFIIL